MNRNTKTDRIIEKDQFVPRDVAETVLHEFLNTFPGSEIFSQQTKAAEFISGVVDLSDYIEWGYVIDRVELETPTPEENAREQAKEVIFFDDIAAELDLAAKRVLPQDFEPIDEAPDLE